MSRRLRAVFRFQVGDDPEDMKPALKLLLRTLRILRIRDAYAQLKITPDDDPAPTYFDADGA